MDSQSENIIKQKPIKLPFCKVVAVIDVPNFWSSQIIIFYNKQYYDTFWDRCGSGQIWKPLKINSASFAEKRNLKTTLLEKGYDEKIYDEEGFVEKSVLWFYGDL